MRSCLSAQHKRILPRVSLMVRSGRGVWLFWLLGDIRDPRKPQRAWPEKITQWTEIQKAIHERLAMCGADARDAARVTRVPGSIHTGTNLEVFYMWQGDRRGLVPVYTLDDMARALNLTRSFGKGPAKRRGGLLFTGEGSNGSSNCGPCGADSRKAAGIAHCCCTSPLC